MTTAQQVRDAMILAAKLDREWMRSDVGHDDLSRYVPWIPFPVHDFVALVAEAMPETTGDRFLDIGAGVGSKVLLADAVFGLNSRGIERVPEYAAEAARHGITVHTVDALDYQGYHQADLIFINRPFYDPGEEAKLEQHVWDSVRTGAVIVGVNLEAPLPASWYPILDDGEIRRWVSQKL